MARDKHLMKTFLFVLFLGGFCANNRTEPHRGVSLTTGKILWEQIEVFTKSRRVKSQSSLKTIESYSPSVKSPHSSHFPFKQFFRLFFFMIFSCFSEWQKFNVDSSISKFFLVSWRYGKYLCGREDKEVNCK